MMVMYPLGLFQSTFRILTKAESSSIAILFSQVLIQPLREASVGRLLVGSYFAAYN